MIPCGLIGTGEKCEVLRVARGRSKGRVVYIVHTIVHSSMYYLVEGGNGATAHSVSRDASCGPGVDHPTPPPVVTYYVVEPHTAAANTSKDFPWGSKL